MSLSRRTAILVMLVLGVSAATCILYRQRREREFRLSLTSAQHYIYAVWLCTPRSGLPPSASDVKAAIHHLEVIPAESPAHPMATDLLPLVRVLRDRPQDFAAEEHASFQRCVARIRAQEIEMQAESLKRPCPGIMREDGKCIIVGCDYGLIRQCAPLARAQHFSQVLAGLLDPP
jgi:hypothetical protein